LSQNIVEKGDLEIIVVAHVLSECIGAAGDALIFLQSPMLPPCEKISTPGPYWQLRRKNIRPTVN